MESNKIENQINDIYSNIAKDVAEQVKNDLAGKVTVIPTGYSPEKDVVGIVQQYNIAKDKIEKEVEYNNSTYKEDVAKIKNYELRLDLQDLQENTLKELANVTIKAEKDYTDRIAKLQKSPDYKEAKNEAFQLLSLIKGSEIPVTKLMEIASPLIETHDVKALEVCEILLQNNATAKYAINAAIGEIKSASEHVELNTMIDTMNKYVTTGADNLDYFNYMYTYGKEGDK